MCKSLEHSLVVLDVLEAFGLFELGGSLMQTRTHDTHTPIYRPGIHKRICTAVTHTNKYHRDTEVLPAPREEADALPGSSSRGLRELNSCQRRGLGENWLCLNSRQA